MPRVRVRLDTRERCIAALARVNRLALTDFLDKRNVASSHVQLYGKLVYGIVQQAGLYEKDDLPFGGSEETARFYEYLERNPKAEKEYAAYVAAVGNGKN